MCQLENNKRKIEELIKKMLDDEEPNIVEHKESLIKKHDEIIELYLSLKKVYDDFMQM